MTRPEEDVKLQQHDSAECLGHHGGSNYVNT